MQAGAQTTVFDDGNVKLSAVCGADDYVTVTFVFDGNALNNWMNFSLTDDAAATGSGNPTQGTEVDLPGGQAVRGPISTWLLPLEERWYRRPMEPNDEYDGDELEDEDEEDGHAEPEVTIEISGLSLYTHMGVSAAEREVGQRLLFDIRLDVGECDATVTDRLEDTVDYADVCDTVSLAAQQRSYKTLERLCAAIADRLLERYEAHAVWVKAAKPEPPIALPVSEVSVEVWREA